ncbi:MAG: hypothetical protein HC821_02120 [Lewinella sp.]|nr:hypothetical protein [Lewinella sp.]
MYWIPLVVLFSALGCTDESKPLHGHWQATAVTQGFDSLALNPAEVGFLFLANGRYEFHSTLRYREAGRYRVENNYLFANDTTSPNSPERVVEIAFCSADSLALRMRQDSSERLVLLLRHAQAD